jgi:serine/threonine-protein kinase BUR1
MAGDHWEPSLDSRDRSSRRGDRNHHHHDHNRLYAARQHDHLSSRRSDWSSASAAHGRDRPRSTSSPPSATHSSSTPTSSHRGLHRLPLPRSPEFNFTPPHREYNVDRRRDREHEHWQRDFHYRDYDDGRSYVPDDRYYQSRGWTQASGGGYPRDCVDDGDRHYRPSSPGSQGRSQRRSMDSSRPFSPNDNSLPPHPITPRGPVGSPPPPPPGAPPPPPPMEPAVEAQIPDKHPKISIAMPLKRPAAPKAPRSPSPLSLPTSTDVTQQAEQGKAEGGSETRESVAKPRKRVPVERSREEEKRHYGRMFEGCGQQSDYEVTTKLGEGTFGCVQCCLCIRALV